MFEKKMYPVGIPIPPKDGTRINELILAIATKHNLQFKQKKEKIKPKDFPDLKDEFHITLGVLKPGLFGSVKELFRHIIGFLNVKENKVIYKKLKDSFQGTGVVVGIGHDGETLVDSQVVWASVNAERVKVIRSQIQYIVLKAISHAISLGKLPKDVANVPEATLLNQHFSSTDPHITLFYKNGDIHGIPKLVAKGGEFANFSPVLSQLKCEKNTPIAFNFTSVIIYSSGKKGTKPLWVFGDAKYNGEPEEKFTATYTRLKGPFQAQTKPKKQPKKIDLNSLNWTALKLTDFEEEEPKIRAILESAGVKGLGREYRQKTGEIKKLLGI